MSSTASTKDFSISPSAAGRIVVLSAKHSSKPARLRISIQGGGCSGFKYNFEFDSQTTDDDTIFTHNNAEVVIDSLSLDMLNGSMLDYVEKLGSSAFEIKNPNATANCGCGNSFSV